MNINYVLGNRWIGLRKIESAHSETLTYSLTVLFLRLEMTTGTSRFYSEISFSLIPVFNVSISFPG